MTLFDRLQRKFGRYAIRGLMRYFIVLYALGFALYLTRPMFYVRYLALDPAAILNGQIWRLVTFLIYPPSFSRLWGLLLLLMYYFLGNTLESVWGSFRFNVFLLTGVLFHILAAFLVYVLTGAPVYLTPENLNLSIFLAFALTFPEMQFYLYFLIPVKAKYMAVLYGVIEIYSFFVGSISEKITIALCLLNLFLFLFWSGTWKRFSPKDLRRRAAFRQAVRQQSPREAKIVSIDRSSSVNRSARHRCTVCGRTELDAPELEFRYCSKCKGDYEYCSDHLYTHRHVE